MGAPGEAQGDLRSRRGRGHETRAQRDPGSGLGGEVMRPAPSAVTPSAIYGRALGGGVMRPAPSAVTPSAIYGRALGGGVMRTAPSAVTPASASPDFSSGGVRHARSAVAWSHPQNR
jgi:hypothetical protein